MSLRASYHRCGGRYDWLVWAVCSAARRRSSGIYNERPHLRDLMGVGYFQGCRPV